MTRRLLALVCLAVLGACGPGTAPQGGGGLAIDRALGDQPGDERFRRVTAAPELAFPRDHGPHPDFRQEWWYFTGNLSTQDGHRFGYQATIFRFALGQGNGPDAVAPASSWRTEQMYMAHLAVTDIDGGTFYAADRFARGALGLAGAQGAPLRVWVEDWSIEGGANDAQAPFEAMLRFADERMAIDLSLRAERPILPQGVDGYSRKGDDPSNASAYYSVTRLQTQGEVRIGDQPVEVTGTSWFDREWGTSFLAPGVEGWDWFSLQLADGRDLMFYRLRDGAGTSTPWSAGALAGYDGEGRWEVERLDAAAVELEVRERWRSPDSTVQYPVSWSLRLPAHDMQLEVEAALDAQELRLATRYWEGAVTVRGRQGERPLSGRGYLELAGYGGE